jgi:hypothetical protein
MRIPQSIVFKIEMARRQKSRFELVEAGEAGLAQYAVEYPLKDKVIVADASRRKLKPG